MWDYYNNIHDQYTFNIAESKVGLSYAQHDMTAREVAKWYTGQSKNYPQDSEMWRTIMGQAAKFLDAAKAQSSASSTARRTAAFTAKQADVYHQQIWPSMYLTQGLVAVGRALGLIPGSTTFQGAEDTGKGVDPAAGINNIGQGGDLLNLVGTQNGQDNIWALIVGAINDPTAIIPGTDQTVQQYFQKVAIDPANAHGVTITAPLDPTDIAAVFSKANNGYDLAIALAKQYGDILPKGYIEQLRNGQVSTTDFGQLVMSFPAQHVYAEQNKNLESVISDPSSDPFAVVKAFGTYLGYINGAIPGMAAVNPVGAAALNAERMDILGNNAGLNPTIAEGALGAPFASSGLPSTGANGNAARYPVTLANAQAMIAQLGTGDYVLRQNPQTNAWETVSLNQINLETGGQYVLMPQQGTATVITPSTSPAAQGGPDVGPGAAAEAVNGAYTINTQKIFYANVYATHPIIVTGPAAALDPISGQPVAGPLASTPGTSTTVGQVAYLPDATGQPTIPVYGIYLGNGIRWTMDNPFQPGSTNGQRLVKDSSGQQSLVVTLNTDPTAPFNNPTTPGAATNTIWVDSKTGAPVTEGTPGAVQTVNPHASTDLSLFGQNSTRSFADPGVAFRASTDGGRQELASMDAQTLFNQYQASPWVNWTDATETRSFWGDIITIRGSAAETKDPSNPLAALGTDMKFWASLSTVRNGGQTDPWVAVMTAQNTGLTQNLPQILHNIAVDKSTVWSGYSGPPITTTPQAGQPGGPVQTTTGAFGLQNATGPTVPGPFGIPQAAPPPQGVVPGPVYGIPVAAPTGAPNAPGQTPTPGVQPTPLFGPQTPMQPVQSPDRGDVTPSISVAGNIAIPGVPKAFAPPPATSPAFTLPRAPGAGTLATPPIPHQVAPEPIAPPSIPVPTFAPTPAPPAGPGGSSGSGPGGPPPITF